MDPATFIAAYTPEPNTVKYTLFYWDILIAVIAVILFADKDDNDGGKQ